jgi:deoxyribose-phosphate aldolase
MNALTPESLAKFFDHTLLKPFATEADFVALCEDARQYGFMMVAVNSAPAAFCKDLLRGSGVHVGAAVSFPLGQTSIKTKRQETINALNDGADEIDYVVNVAKLLDGDYAYVEREMREIVAACRERGAISKAIFENCYLPDDKKKKLCEIALKAMPDFIKTSTGFGPGGATAEDVKLMKSMVGDSIKVKASGGIRTLEAALRLITLGAERIGSSMSREIVDAFRDARGQGKRGAGL